MSLNDTAPSTSEDSFTTKLAKTTAVNTVATAATVVGILTAFSAMGKAKEILANRKLAKAINTDLDPQA